MKAGYVAAIIIRIAIIYLYSSVWFGSNPKRMIII